MREANISESLKVPVGSRNPLSVLTAAGIEQCCQTSAKRNVEAEIKWRVHRVSRHNTVNYLTVDVSR